MTFQQALDATGCKDRAALARYLGVSRQQIYYWVKTDRIPEVWVYRIAALTEK